MKTKKLIIYILCTICFVVLLNIGRRYILEGFRQYNPNTPLTNHNVDLPINTFYSCKNFCGPKSQCAITREQCTSDIDCYGCQPVMLNSLQSSNITMEKDDKIVGDNDAGKMVYNINPRYSVLTTDIGTEATIYNDKFINVPKPYLGVDKWVKISNYGLQNQRDEYSYNYSTKPNEYKFIPHYPKRESVTGLFIDTGPLASNAYL